MLGRLAGLHPVLQALPARFPPPAGELSPPSTYPTLMDNPFVPRDDSAHTSGLGWESRGVRLLPSYLCTAFKTKDLKVYYEGEPGYLTAMNKDSLWITYSR